MRRSDFYSSHISGQRDCAPRGIGLNPSSNPTPKHHLPQPATFMSPDDDPFAPVNDSLPQTPPTRSSNAWLLSYSPSQTHPAESPTYSPNTIGLRFGNRKGRNLIREGAVILRPKQRVPVPTSPTPRVPNYYRGKAGDQKVINVF